MPTLTFISRSRLQTNLLVFHQLHQTQLLTNKHSVFVRVPSIFDDWNDVGAFFRHVEKVPTRPVGKLYCIDQPFLSHKTCQCNLLLFPVLNLRCMYTLIAVHSAETLRPHLIYTTLEILH